jgi:uncharacterized protein
MRFDWDSANLAHIALHKLDPDEAEDAVLDEDALDFPAHRGPKGQRRFGLIGKTLLGRVLVVILEDAKKAFGSLRLE